MLVFFYVFNSFQTDLTGISKAYSSSVTLSKNYYKRSKTSILLNMSNIPPDSVAFVDSTMNLLKLLDQ